MKKFLRKTFALLLTAAILFSFSACTPAGEDEPGYSGTGPYTGAERFAAIQVQDYVDSIYQVEGQISSFLSEYAEDEVTYKSLKAYMDACVAYGGGVFATYYTSNVSNTDDGYVVRSRMYFGDTEVEIQMTLLIDVATENYMTGEVTYGIYDAKPLTIDKVLSVGEKMGNAGLNTLLGMGTVFIVLILICLIIYLFGFINKFENRAKGKNDKNVPAAQDIEIPSVTAKNAADDTELVAVIAAAIAAAEGTDPSGIIVRSIRKVGNANTWKRG